MTRDELRARFPNASVAFINQNADEPIRATQGPAGGAGVRPGHRRAIAFVERDLGDGGVGEIPIQKAAGGRFLVRVKAFRRRLLDEDNLCEKYHVDLCRYAGILPEDSPGTAKIEVSQEKVGSKEREFTRIEVFKL